MRIKAYQIEEPLPRLTNTQVVAMIEPWINAGSVGSMAISWLEKEAGARPLGELARPAGFYDLTRYRPITYFQGDKNLLRFPNTRVSFARQNDGTDFVFIRILEPHMHSDYFIDSTLELLAKLNVSRYLLIGSMYNFVPHTRPPMVSGSASPEYLQKELEKYGMFANRYEGPTTVCSLITQSVVESGGETATIIVNLPQYTQLEDDYIGTLRLQKILSSLYYFPIPEESIRIAEAQREQIEEAIKDNPQIQEIIRHLERSYDSNIIEPEDNNTSPKLAPEIEDFLREMERRFRRE